jgi:restriction system protein
MTKTCSICGMLLEDGNHGPCPICGSTKKTINLKVHSAVHVITSSRVNLEVISNTASLLLQSVIIPGAKTNEGQLIEAVALPWFDIIELLSRDPSLAFQIESRKWEEIIAGAYHKAKFDEVTLTPRSGDLGRDIIAVKRGIGTVRIIDQVKAYGPNHLVTANDVRALLGVLEGDKASKGFLTTTSDFAPMLREDLLLRPFMPSRLELINGNMLLARLNELAKNKS